MPNTLKAHSYLTCMVYCTADSYDLKNLAHFFKKRGYYTHLVRDVLHVTNLKRPGGDLFFYNFGCFVSWGFKKSFESKLIDYVKEFALNAIYPIEVDQLFYHYGNDTTIAILENQRLDIITLDTTDPQIKLAISYGLAQSIKLESFEESVQTVIRKNANLPQEMATKGIISLSRRAIFKRMGEIFIVRSSINLNLEYLDIPEFFWRNPNLEPFYIMTNKFLDIPNRVMALNQKIDVLQELLHIMNSQVQHRHSSLLEIIIIVLIAAEIIISLLQFKLV